MLVAIADMGGSAFLCDADLNGHPSDEWTYGDYIGERTWALTEELVEIEPVEGNRKWEISEDDYIVLLSAVRGAYESFGNPSERALKHIMMRMDLDDLIPKGKITSKQRMHFAFTAHVLLDFLECHAPPEVLSRWIEDRKATSVDMLNWISEQLLR